MLVRVCACVRACVCVARVARLGSGASCEDGEKERERERGERERERCVCDSYRCVTSIKPKHHPDRDHHIQMFYKLLWLFLREMRQI